MAGLRRWSQGGRAVGANAPRCSSCRKRTYPTRRDAKRAIRVLYPALKGDAMTVYRCPGGGTGWHLGHRDARFADDKVWTLLSPGPLLPPQGHQATRTSSAPWDAPDEEQ